MYYPQPKLLLITELNEEQGKIERIWQKERVRPSHSHATTTELAFSEMPRIGQSPDMDEMTHTPGRHGPDQGGLREERHVNSTDAAQRHHPSMIPQQKHRSDPGTLTCVEVSRFAVFHVKSPGGPLTAAPTRLRSISQREPRWCVNLHTYGVHMYVFAYLV